jgi:hypothetical protein
LSASKDRVSANFFPAAFSNRISQRLQSFGAYGNSLLLSFYYAENMQKLIPTCSNYSKASAEPADSN